MKDNKELIKEFKKVKEFDNLSSLDSENTESYSDRDISVLSSSSPKSVDLEEQYYDEEEDDNGDDEDYREGPEEDDDGEEDEDHSQNISNSSNITCVLNKIIEKLTQLTLLTTNFNQFKKEINFKLEGKHTEYEILIEELMNNVRKEGNKQSLLVKNLRDELIGRKLKNEEVGNIAETVQSANNIKFDSNLELLNQAQTQDIQEARKLINKAKYSPTNHKITATSFILSLIIGILLGFGVAYMIKNNNWRLLLLKNLKYN